MNLRPFLKHIGNDNSGATAIEYGLIISLLCIAVLGALTSFASEVDDLWTGVAEDVLAASQDETP